MITTTYYSMLIPLSQSAKLIAYSSTLCFAHWNLWQWVDYLFFLLVIWGSLCAGICFVLQDVEYCLYFYFIILCCMCACAVDITWLWMVDVGNVMLCDVDDWFFCFFFVSLHCLLSHLLSFHFFVELDRWVEYNNPLHYKLVTWYLILDLFNFFNYIFCQLLLIHFLFCNILNPIINPFQKWILEIST